MDARTEFSGRSIKNSSKSGTSRLMIKDEEKSQKEDDLMSKISKTFSGSDEK